MHSSRRDAFKAINAQPLGRITSAGSIEWNGARAKRDDANKEKLVADTRFEPRVAVLKAYPSSEPAMLDFLVDKGIKGVVLEGTGLGYVPTQTREAKYSWLPSVKRAVEKGVVLAMTTQCLFGRVHPFVYSDLRILSGAGVVYCEDLLPETAFVKLGCALARARSAEEAKKLMLENWCGEVGAPTRANEYLD
jgi:glutamyl-tRNA(Gln) amidotransferase subunit D